MKRVHLDFHTSPDIKNIGSLFNKVEFTKTVKEAKIDSMTVFAKCHHGYTYYPSKVGTMHPGLEFDLLKEEIEAIHNAGARAPIYITVGWSKKDADEHPEWHQIDFYTGRSAYVGNPYSADPDAPIEDCSWITLCPSGPYLEHIKSLTHEVCQRFHPVDGIFYDIVFFGDACICEACKEGMRQRGLNPRSIDDARRYYTDKRIEILGELSDIVHSYAPEATVFFNSGGADMNRPEYHSCSTHFELEDLPTAWGGYDEMPIRAKYFEKYGKPFIGMTGKFHHNWGEFGGFKNKDALKYEIADMMSVGARMSIGDHLHPSGKLDRSTYSEIGYAYSYIDSIKEYTVGTAPYSDLALWIRHERSSDIGAAKILSIMHLEYDVIESGADLERYKCIILPDAVALTDDDKSALTCFVNGGGKIIASYDSIFEGLGIEKIAPSEYDMDFIQCDMDDVKTPFLSYSHAFKVKTDGEVLAHVHEPYFNRTHKHFCGHKNTPFKIEHSDYPALVRYNNVIYMAHPVFEAYDKTGSYLLEKFIIKAIELAYDSIIKVENLPSCGRVRFRKGIKDNYYLLHTLYSVPINRGNVHLLEDFPTLHDVKFTIKSEHRIKEIFTVPGNNPISFTQLGDDLSFTLPPFSLHCLTVIKW